MSERGESNTHGNKAPFATTDRLGYQPATMETEKRLRLVDFIRNDNRVIYKDFTLAKALWNELKPYALREIGDSVAIGLNESFRFYKYEPGQQFKKAPEF